MKASTRGYIEALTEKHKMEKQLDEVRLQMLKNQINPHFLFKYPEYDCQHGPDRGRGRH